MYELVDFGNGRKLERFSELLVDRPCPVASGPGATSQWGQADARFEPGKGHRGTWTFAGYRPENWQLPTVFGKMHLFPTDFGHVGVFVEQQQNWSWLQALPLTGMKILNLFAYTGGSSLAAASAGASVTHIDSAKNMVRRASENAQLSKLQEKPIRWIVEDARKFVQREFRRGNRYDGVILDPPTYGHGATAKSTWKIDDHLADLLRTIRDIVPNCKLMLFTCHSAGYTPSHMNQLVNELRGESVSADRGVMNLETPDGRALPCGNFVRWCSRKGTAS